MQRGNKKKKKATSLMMTTTTTTTESLPKLDPELYTKKLLLAKEKYHTMLARIRNHIQDCGNIRDVANESFCIIAFNTLVKTEEKVCLPAEIGLIEYSISAGVIDQYHEFIDPGKLPEGFKCTCIEESRGSHGIPVEDFSLASSDYTSIFHQVIKRIKKSVSGEFTYRVYTMTEDISTVEMCLEWLQEKSDSWCEAEFEVFDLVYLLVELREFVQIRTGQNVGILPAIAKACLTRYIYDYESNIGCMWHDEEDRTKFCSLGVAKRLAYLLSDQLCEVYRVEFIPEKHLPVRSNNSPYETFSDYKVGRRMGIMDRPQERRVSADSDSCITKKRSIFADNVGPTSHEGFVTDTGLACQLENLSLAGSSSERESPWQGEQISEDEETTDQYTSMQQRFYSEEKRIKSAPALQRYDVKDRERSTKSTSALIEPSRQELSNWEDKDRYVKSTSALVGSPWQEEQGNSRDTESFQRLDAACGDSGVDDENSLRSLDTPSFIGSSGVAPNFVRSPPNSQRIPFSPTTSDGNIFEHKNRAGCGRCVWRNPRDN